MIRWSPCFNWKSRPVAAEYPQIADQIRQAIENVYYGIKQPKQALDDDAKDPKVLGW
jgi:multiple sugar transport system substrate-binding protein